MKILAIHDGHNSGATLLVDGKIIASVSEERLTRKKNEIGYPRLSVEEVLSIGNCAASEVDHVVYASNFMHSADHLARASEWYRSGLNDQRRDAKQTDGYLKAVFDKRRAERIKDVVNQIGLSGDRISFVDHHLAHGAAAYFGSHFSLEEPILILTCDGAGDGLSATVSVGQGTKISRLAETPRKASIGKVYSRVTYILGLTPWEHEYKVMGLAPYADPKYAEEIRDVLREHLTLSEDGLSLALAGEVESSYLYEFLRDRFEAKRFDAIAGGVQMFTEEILADWVRNAVEHTGIRRIVCGGGVFMNVKANKCISELEEVDDIYIFPSCGDESLSLGAAWLEHYRLTNTESIKDRFVLKDLYLGREFDEPRIASDLEEFLADSGCTYERKSDIEQEVAELLAENNIVARFSGRMEWGARALGNRSILANPKEWPNVEKINSMIKMRDFWMPFAPSMLAEESNRYLRNPKNIRSPFMMMGYDTIQETASEIGAAIHPRDKTARAQLVEKETNPRYWSLIKAFEEITGTACVLNTSFNLHGYPLVNTPEDAIYVFLNSGLDYLAIGDFLVSKPDLSESRAVS